MARGLQEVRFTQKQIDEAVDKIRSENPTAWKRYRCLLIAPPDSSEDRDINSGENLSEMMQFLMPLDFIKNSSNPNHTFYCLLGEMSHIVALSTGPTFDENEILKLRRCIV